MVVRVQRYPVASWPFESLFDFERGIDDLFGNFLGTGLVTQSGRDPAIDVAEYDNESVVVAEMPGVRKEDMKISVQDGVLSITGERKGHELPEGSRWIRNEVRTGQFSRTVELPHEVKTDAISAELNNGVLRIVLPKAEEAKPREIQVQ